MYYVMVTYHTVYNVSTLALSDLLGHAKGQRPLRGVVEK